MTIENLDLAHVLPCQVCKKPTRHMGGVPIAGTGLDLTFADKTTCGDCLQRKTTKAADPVRHKVAKDRNVILTPWEDHT